MTMKIASRRELLDRWRGIEEQEEAQDDNDDPLKQRHLHQQKEQWFAGGFNFLISLPKEKHIWCGSWDIMGPLLETFYNYFKDERHDSPLRLLWKRISQEMLHCIECISQHHQAQDMYNVNYELSSIGPLLDVLRSLDEERLTQQLREMNSRLTQEKYDPSRDNTEVVSVMYEVLMYPSLLDDQSLFTEFEIFIEAVDNMHELALAGPQQYPGVYALLFFNRRVRMVGRRLARSMGKLRSATDLEPLQPLLKKFIGLLETEMLPSTFQTSRPRMMVERLPVWLGITSLLEFLEPPAFEEGILESYPIFFDIVLNHISGDSPEFSHAVSCLRELFKMLGCKLWLRSTLSPSVMRNTLLGQCFHTRNEKIHKDIFDLFQPFLQSLEALQDGEHEKQRRHFLYFLLHQVPVSSNFSALMRKTACKIAFLIIHRGYKMNPPCPPFECSHMWGPSLVSSLKDSSLHSSLRQPAFDLIQTIIVSDATALISSLLNCRTSLCTNESSSTTLISEEEHSQLPFAPDAEEKDSWSEFSTQSKIISPEYREWMCIPMLWLEVLVDIGPSVLPVTFSKAVFWARSHFSMVEPESSAEMALDVRSWLSSSAKEISTTLGWKVPTDSDDGGAGKESKNSIEVSTMCLPLIRTFNRLNANFVVQMGQGELRKQWTWEPRMAGSLILLLFDPNDNVRQFGKCILEQISNTRGLAGGLKFLCSYSSSLSAMFFGLAHALKLVKLDSVLSKFHALQHFFFVLCKLIKEGDSAYTNMPEKSAEELSNTKFSSQGGFLKQPVVNCFPLNAHDDSLMIDLKFRDRFLNVLSETAWPSLLKCLVEGKAFFDYSICQMTCVRILEVLPVVFGRLYPCVVNKSVDSVMVVRNGFDFKWLHDLMDWGKSQLKVVVVYWKRSVASVLTLLKGSCANASVARAVENLISVDCIDMDQLTEQVSCLCVSLSKEASSYIGKMTLESKASFSECLNERKYSASGLHPLSLEDTNPEVLDSVLVSDIRNKGSVIILSDDEMEQQSSVHKVISDTESSYRKDDKKMFDSADVSVPQMEPAKKNASSMDSSKQLVEAFRKRHSSESSDLASEKKEFDKSRGILSDSFKSKVVDDGLGDGIKSINRNGFSSSQFRADLRNAPDESAKSKSVNQSCNKVLSRNDVVLKELVKDTEDDPLESALKTTRHQSSFLSKSGPFVPKRQLIQLKSPVETQVGQSHRLGAGVKRFKPPRLDDWYKPILEMDYFATVGLAPSREDVKHTVCKMKEVPTCFQSPEQYVNIFRPLVLEEFKAQLHSSYLEMSSWQEMCCGSLSVLSVERIDDFHLVRFVHDEDDSNSSRSFSENDLVLITKEPLQKTSHDIHVVGKVERREKDNKRRSSVLLIRFYLQNGSSRLNKIRRNLLERSKWHTSRIMSITPQLREFQALSTLKDIPILPVILNPVTDSHGHTESRRLHLHKLPQPLQQILKSSFNDSQLQAISVATRSLNLKKDFELSLIQGPPGTGKTRTIVAIISVLLASPLQSANASKTSSNSDLKRNFSSSTTSSRLQISQSAAVARAWQDAALARQLYEDVERNKKLVESSARGRVLICAQSNAAVDELVSRISCEGLYGRDGKMYKPYLVRVGNAKTVHPNSLPFFLDTLVDNRLAEEMMHLRNKNDSNMDSSVALRSNLEKLVDRIRFYETKRANLRDGSLDNKNSLEDGTHKEDDAKEVSDADLEAMLRKLYEQKKQIYKDLTVAQAQERKTNGEIKALKYKLRKSILKEAEIVVTTLSGCGGDLYGVCSEAMSSFRFGTPSEDTLFDAVVIDEAAQALEPATLIPLQLLKSSGTTCFMVGDPKQLPATVLSNVASKFLFECSMFERLQRAGHPVVMLTQQYRMHPEICRFPSLHFYDNKLLNGDQISNKSAIFHESEFLRPYVFYDIIDGQELRGKNSGAFSLYNEHEADAAVEVLRFFRKRYPSEFVGGRIGIVTPYKSQLSLLRSHFFNTFGSSTVADMEFNTVDGFQGREVDILILSTVRAADSCSTATGVNSSSIGFVADIRRMNVALTRAKLSLWILGNSRTLQTNHNWAALVKDAKKRNLVVTVKRPYGTIFKTYQGPNPASANPCGQSRRRKHAKNVGENSELSEQHECKGEADLYRKMKGEDIDYVGPGNRTLAEDAKHSAEREMVQSSSKKMRDEQDLSVRKNLPSIAAKIEDTSKSVKSANSGKHVKGNKTEDCGTNKLDAGAIYLAKRKGKCKNFKSDLGHTERETSDGHITSEPNLLKASEKASEHASNKKNSKILDPSTEDCWDGNDANNGARAPNQVGTSGDLLGKRKQQREAVDAILCSALIPSKKSTKPMHTKRPISSASSINYGIKPPKARKVLPTNSASRSEGEIHHRHNKCGKSLSSHDLK